MATLYKITESQSVKSAEFELSYGDTMVNTSGSAVSIAVAGGTFDIIGLPRDSIVVGGEIVEETAFAGASAIAVTIGDSGSATRYLGSTDLLGTSGRTALVPTGYVNTDGLSIRLAFTPTGTTTAGKLRVRVEYVVQGKADEVTG